MNLRDLDIQEIHAQQIRDLQSRFPVEHEALLNWGAWGRHRQIGPGFPHTHVFDLHDGDVEGYADEAVPVTEAPVKAEMRRADPYEEKPAVILDERIHSAGGLCLEVRRALKTAYVNGGPREGYWFVFANCNTPEAFLERLEAGLRFTRRFI